jgi:phospholipase C
VSGTRLSLLILCFLALCFAIGCRGLASSPVQSGIQLTVTTSGSGSGTVTSSPGGINCPGTCTAMFPSGTQVTLSATQNGFAGWGGACSGNSLTCTITLSSSENVSASFAQQTAYSLTVTASATAPATGTVVSSPAGISCPGTCSANFSTGSQVTLTETPGAPSTFSAFGGWSGACTGNTATCTVTISAAQSVTATFTPAINHIIFMAQENRGFEHYFGELRQYWANNGIPDQSYDGLPQFNPAAGSPPLLGPAPTNPGCDPAFPPPADCTIDSNSPDVTSFEMVSMCEENPSPSWNESHADFNRAAPESGTPLLDGYVWTAGHDARALGYYDVDGIRAMSYYTSDQLPFYYFMASTFGTSDAWHSPEMSRTQPNRLYILAATSAGHAYPPTSTLSNPTIFDLLQAAGISWKVYVTDLSRAPKPVQDSALNFFTTASKYPNNIVPGDDFFTDLTNGTLPAVAYIEPGYDAGLDEHPGVDDGVPGANIQLGAKYVSEIMTQLMNSSSWKDSAFVFTYDEFGGFHDHVAPQPTVSPDGIKPIDLMQGDICNKGTTGPTCDFTYTGYRVPLIVVSPYSKKNYVSHTVADTTAWLKLVETRFGIPNLTARDAAQFDMTEFFDFVNVPWAVPPTNIPVQPTNGQCYVNKLP